MESNKNNIKKQKRIKRQEISKIILKISEGMLSSLTDLVLWNLFYFIEISPLGDPTNLRKAEFLAHRNLEKFNYLTIKQTIYNAKSRGWIKEDFTLTKEGKERLENFIPAYFNKKKWDGNWYLVSYDIPENKRRYRDILRDNLKRLGLGEMHASLWISPFNFLREIEKIIKEYNLSSFVILAISDKVGKDESKIFADKIWKLREINKNYLHIIQRTEKSTPKNLVFKYLSILSKDPQLPTDLLPEDWMGDKAYLIFKNYIPTLKQLELRD
jgi:phenylacetic acid degradation operon negative regulatory protein